MNCAQNNLAICVCRVPQKLAQLYSAEYSVGLRRIFGIGRYHFLAYRLFTTSKF